MEATLGGAFAAACEDALGRPGSAAVIAADEQIPALAATLTGAGVPHVILEGAATGEIITLVPVTLAKGLEFDQVIVYEPARIAAAEMRGLHRLYVALTRAVSRLTVLHAEPLPPALSDQVQASEAQAREAQASEAQASETQASETQAELVLSQPARD